MWWIANFNEVLVRAAEFPFFGRGLGFFDLDLIRIFSPSIHVSFEFVLLLHFYLLINDDGVRSGWIEIFSIYCLG